MEPDTAAIEFPWRKNYMPPFAEMLGRLLELAKAPLPGSDARVLNGRLAVIERTYPGDYESTDSLSDWEAEPVRADCREKNYRSPISAWRDLCAARQVPDKDPAVCRELVYKAVRGCNLFNVAFAVYLLRGSGEWAGLPKESPGDVLDPCAGWGDRLGAAFIAGARSYRGWDTNPRLQPVYRALAARYEHAGLALDWDVRDTPFETAPDHDIGLFDTVLTSPPFFDKELYEGNATSTTKYRTLDAWYKSFYRVLWRKAARALRPGGRVIAYVPPGRMFKEANTMLTEAGLVYVGAVGFLQTTGDGQKKESAIRDAFIWRLPGVS